jgi:hypothetical protein
MRNRIIGHRRVKAGDLVPHELNPRVHSDDQRAALAAIYKEVGYARSVVAYPMPDGRLKLIDGHLRVSEHPPDFEIDVEVLDVTDAEARKLIMTLDPLAGLATYNDGALLGIQNTIHSDDAILSALWASLRQGPPPQLPGQEPTANKQNAAPKYLVIIECANEAQQAANLFICMREGMVAKSVSS